MLWLLVVDQSICKCLCDLSALIRNHCYPGGRNDRMIAVELMINDVDQEEEGLALAEGIGELTGAVDLSWPRPFIYLCVN
eukprot:gene34739-44926_t